MRGRPARWLLFLSILVVTIPGCKNSQKYDLIEAELRSRNAELDELRGEVEHLRMLSRAQGHLTHASSPFTPPGPAPTLDLKEIALGNGTGGASTGEACLGDSQLQVVIVPKDCEGSAVKVPARVQVLAFEILPNGVKNPIGRWDVEPDKLRKHWKGSLLTTGYFLTLAWDTPPRFEKLRVAVRFTTLNGGVYEADKDVTVRVMNPAQAPMSVPMSVPMMPGSQELPPPRPAVILGPAVGVP